MLIMSHMAKDQTAILSASALAEKLHLMPPTVSKILKILAEGGLVRSVRGAEGGYHLALPPEKITLATILSIMEGDLALTECCDKKERCALHATCVTRSNWQKINAMVKQILDNWTIADMLTPLSGEVFIHGK